MIFYQRKLSEDDLKQIEEQGVDSMFTDVQRRSIGIINPHVVNIRGEKYLRWQNGQDVRNKTN